MDANIKKWLDNQFKYLEASLDVLEIPCRGTLSNLGKAPYTLDDKLNKKVGLHLTSDALNLVAGELGVEVKFDDFDLKDSDYTYEGRIDYGNGYIFALYDKEKMCEYLESLKKGGN